MRLGTPRLDFVVIGAQKAGTTALWRLLEDNPGLRMPPGKEAPFFVQDAYRAELRAHLRALFAGAPRHVRLGTVTPPYMVGVPGVPVPEVARRIREVFPAVRLVALLRDPVERARSAHRMWVRRGGEKRTFADAVEAQLAPAALERSRREPMELESYVAAGEYGRMLSAYLAKFPREQLHVELTSELERSPEDVVARVCEFVGVERHTPARLGERFHEAGRRRVSREAEEELRRYLEAHVWPHMRDSRRHAQEFEYFFAMWNVEAEPPEDPVDAATRERLLAHYADDARLLEEAVGVRVEWAG